MSRQTITLDSLGVNSVAPYFEFSLYETPSNAVPTLGGVYAIWEHNELVYIGKASNLRSRFYLHRDDKDGSFAWLTCVTFMPIPDEAQRVITEKWLIRHWTPKYNKHRYGAEWQDKTAKIFHDQVWSYDPLQQIIYNNRDGCPCGCSPVQVHVSDLTPAKSSEVFNYLWNYHETDALDFSDALKKFGLCLIGGPDEN